MDRISELPDSLILHILSRLSPKEVKATSVLSKTWLRITDSITLDLCFNDSRIPRADFPSFVHRVLCRGHTNLRSVTLHLNFVYDADQTQHWIKAMEARNVKEVNLFLRHCYVLVPELFVCKTVEVLHVSCSVHIKLPPLIRLPSLKILNLILEDIDFSIGVTVAKLISGCPELEELNLMFGVSPCKGILLIQSSRLKKFELRFCSVGHNPTSIGELRLDTPALEFLDVSFLYAVPQVYLISRMPSLCDIKIAVSLQEEQVLDNSVHARVGFIREVDYIKALSLCSTTLKILNLGPMAALPLFPNLTRLEVGLVEKFEPCMRLLEHMPNLEELVLQMVQWSLKAWKMAQPDGVPPQCLLKSLRTVEFNNFRGSKSEMKMAKYFLRHGGALEIMKISLYKSRGRRSATRGIRFADFGYIMDRNLNVDSIRQNLAMAPSASVARELIIIP
uniref:F-box domain-containing protein n=1 Tax=Kalanchoe fedtschenkoi TaxID=63787 RepID=A0A7N0UNZ0_KALFE